MKFLNKLEELADLATTYLETFRESGQLPAINISFMDLCYNILYINALEQSAAEPRELPAIQGDHTDPVQLKPVVKQATDTQAPNAGQAAPQAPQFESQEFIDTNYNTYFDFPWITVFIRRRHCKNGSIKEFFSTRAKTGKLLDVCFPKPVEAYFKENMQQSAIFMPTQFIIQQQNAYAKIYITEIGNFMGAAPVQIIDQQ